MEVAKDRLIIHEKNWFIKKLKMKGRKKTNIHTESVEISKLGFSEYNPRKISEEEFSGLVESIKSFGLVDPIIINRDYTIIGGHQRVRACKDLGYTHVDCVILDLDKKTEKKLNVVLNSPAISGQFDEQKLSLILDELRNDEDFESLRLDALEPPKLDESLASVDDFYTRKIETPVYEPKNEKPDITELCNMEKYEKLVSDIESSGLSGEIKKFLKLAATRHLVFDYEKIADYYAHASKNVQRFFEDSALVIIDFKRALELGYIRLRHNIIDQFLSEYGNDDE